MDQIKLKFQIWSSSRKSLQRCRPTRIWTWFSCLLIHLAIWVFKDLFIFMFCLNICLYTTSIRFSGTGELQTVVHCHMGARMKPGCSARAARTLNCPDHSYLLFLFWVLPSSSWFWTLFIAEVYSWPWTLTFFLTHPKLWGCIATMSIFFRRWLLKNTNKSGITVATLVISQPSEADTRRQLGVQEQPVLL